jgi:hypothetical protein
MRWPSALRRRCASRPVCFSSSHTGSMNERARSIRKNVSPASVPGLSTSRHAPSVSRTVGGAPNTARLTT